MVRSGAANVKKLDIKTARKLWKEYARMTAFIYKL